MAVDFIYTPDRRYRDYVVSHNVKENLDIVLSKPIREAVGSIEDIFKRNTEPLTEALKDFTWFPSGRNENVEVARISLWAMCGTSDARCADTVSGFQALFVKADECNPSLAGLECADADERYGIALRLARNQQYEEALQTLRATPVERETDWRCDQLRGVLLSGIAGQPKSAEVVDLRGAEEAFVTAAERVRAADRGAAAHAMVGAGKAAYAAGRIGDAVGHFAAAIELDARCGEAHYQWARLHMQAQDHDGVRRHLPRAFDCHWSYGVRAASDPVLARRPALVVQCIAAATRDLLRDARNGLAEAAGHFKFLQAQQDKFYPLADDLTFAPLTANIRSAPAGFRTRLLKRAFDARKSSHATQRTVARLAKDYVARLRTAEDAIVRRDERVRLRRDPGQVVQRWARFMRFWMSLAVALLFGGAGYVVASSPDPWGGALQQSLSMIGGALALLLILFVPVGGSKLQNALVSVVAGWQRVGRFREQRRNAASVRRNRAALRDRLQRIEQRFGLAAPPVQPPAEPETSSGLQWAERPMVPAE